MLDHIAPRSREYVATRMTKVAQGELVPPEFEYDILKIPLVPPVSYELLQLFVLFLQLSDFFVASSSDSIAQKSLFSGFQKILVPSVIQIGVDPSSLRQIVAMLSLPRIPSRTILIFSSAEYFFLVLLLISLTTDSVVLLLPIPTHFCFCQSNKKCLLI